MGIVLRNGGKLCQAQIALSPANRGPEALVLPIYGMLGRMETYLSLCRDIRLSPHRPALIHRKRFRHEQKERHITGVAGGRTPHMGVCDGLYTYAQPLLQLLYNPY